MALQQYVMYNCNLIKGKKIYNYRACSSDDTGQQSGRRFTVTDMGCPCTIRLNQHHGTQSVHVHVYRCTLSPLNSTNTTAHNLYTYRYTGVPSTHSTLNSTNTTAHNLYTYRCVVSGVQVCRPLIHLSTQPTPLHNLYTYMCTGVPSTHSPLNSTNTTAHNLYTYRCTGVPSTHSTLNSTNTTAHNLHTYICVLYRCDLYKQKQDIAHFVCLR